jgi:hypothetical protein
MLLYLTVPSGGLLQPNQPALWLDYRVLFPTVLPRDEGYG